MPERYEAILVLNPLGPLLAAWSDVLVGGHAPAAAGPGARRGWASALLRRGRALLRLTGARVPGAALSVGRRARRAARRAPRRRAPCAGPTVSPTDVGQLAAGTSSGSPTTRCCVAADQAQLPHAVAAVVLAVHRARGRRARRAAARPPRTAPATAPAVDRERIGEREPVADAAQLERATGRAAAARAAPSRRSRSPSTRWRAAPPSACAPARVSRPSGVAVARTLIVRRRREVDRARHARVLDDEARPAAAQRRPRARRPRAPTSPPPSARRWRSARGSSVASNPDQHGGRGASSGSTADSGRRVTAVSESHRRRAAAAARCRRPGRTATSATRWKPGEGAPSASMHARPRSVEPVVLAPQLVEVRRQGEVGVAAPEAVGRARDRQPASPRNG